MEQPQILIDLSSMVEYKINQRNKLAQQRPRPDGIIQIIDREIDIHEKCIAYFHAVQEHHAKLLIQQRNKSFSAGRQAGIMYERTGRNHDQYFQH